MKQAYLLPCKCGQKVEVDSTLAGLTVKCACGRTLDVPTMRDLTRLELAGANAPGAEKLDGRSWGPRQGYTLAGILVALFGLGWLGYQLWTMPEDLYIVPEAIRAETESLSPAELVEQFRALSRGLDPTEPRIVQATRLYQEWHRRWTYVAAAVSLLGAVLAATAWFTLGANANARRRPIR